MKKPFLLFALKCSVILYFAACTRIEHYTADRSVTPIVTAGSWVVSLYAGNQKTGDFAGYSFTFQAGGNILAGKDGRFIKGNWLEDDISKKIVINMPSTDPLLSQLNRNWKIARIADGKITLEQEGQPATYNLSISSAPLNQD